MSFFISFFAMMKIHVHLYIGRSNLSKQMANMQIKIYLLKNKFSKKKLVMPVPSIIGKVYIHTHTHAYVCVRIDGRKHLPV